MAKTIQKLWDHMLSLLFAGGKTKEVYISYIYTTCIMKYGAVWKFDVLYILFP